MFPVKFWEREKKPESSVLRVPAFLIGNVSEHKKNGEADGFTVLLFWIIQRVFLLL